MPASLADLENLFFQPQKGETLNDAKYRFYAQSGFSAADITDFMKAFTDPWKAWTPVISGIGSAIGDGTAVGRYKQLGKTVFFRSRVTRGASTLWGTAGVQQTVPVQGNNSIAANLLNIHGTLFRTGANSYALFSGIASLNNPSVIVPYIIGTGGGATKITDTVPSAGTAGDYLELSGTYESA